MNQDFYNSPEYLSLHEKSLVQLGLSSESHNLLTGVGVETVGDCVDYFLITRIVRTANVPIDVVKTMETEVIDKLKELGYWGIISDYINGLP